MRCCQRLRIIIFILLTRVKDSHELAVAQEDKNERAKNAFGIRDDFIPGSSLDNKRLLEQDVDAEKSGPPRKVTKVSLPWSLLYGMYTALRVSVMFFLEFFEVDLNFNNLVL